MLDGELFEAWCRGDRRAGAQLFERHYDAIARFFHNKAAGDADDLIQRTFLRCVETSGRIRKAASFRFFLFGVARNVLLEYLGEKGRRQKREVLNFMTTSVEDLQPTPSSALDRAREERLILAALRRIPLEFQIVLELYYWEDLRARELSRERGHGEFSWHTEAYEFVRDRKAIDLLAGSSALREGLDAGASFAALCAPLPAAEAAFRAARAPHLLYPEAAP